jgi:hypothetical protein
MAPMDSCSQTELNPPPDTLKVPVSVLLVHPGHLVYVFGKDDETLPNFIKRKHPSKGEKKNQGQGPKSKQANNPKEVGHKEAREPRSTKTSTKTSTGCLKHIN